VDVQSKFQKQLDNAIERYASGVPAQVALSSAPVILGVIFPPAALVPAGLQAGIAARASRIQQERIDEAPAGVADQLEHLDQDKVDAKWQRITVFGEHRVVFGGDCPPVLAAASAGQWVQTLDDLTACLGPDAKRKLFIDHARRFYRLPAA